MKLLWKITLALFVVAFIWRCGYSAAFRAAHPQPTTYDECTTRLDGSTYCGAYDDKTRVLLYEYEQEGDTNNCDTTRPGHDPRFALCADLVTWTREVCVGGWHIPLGGDVLSGDEICTWNHPLRQVSP